LTGRLLIVIELTVAAVLVAAVVSQRSNAQFLDLETYASLGAATAASALLSIRWRPNRGFASFIAVPVVTAYARFGFVALPSVAAGLIFARGVHGALRLLQNKEPAGSRSLALRDVALGAVLVETAHDVVSFAVANLVADLVPNAGSLAAVLFAVSFIVGRHVIRWAAARIESLPTTDPEGEQPSLPFDLLIAPLAALPVLAGSRLGDGALLVSIAALLLVFIDVREASNLRVARIGVEAERDQLAAAQQLQEELIDLITHDLKSPLTAILGCVHLGRSALDHEQPDRLPKYLGQIDQGAREIERLIDNLVRLSQLERMGEPLPTELISLRVLVTEAVGVLGPLAERKRQELAPEYTPTPLYTRAPLALLRECLNNLVSNAIKYTGEGGNITVWCRAGDQPDRVELGVTDTGIGLSAEDLQHLFTRFYRSSDPRASEQRGSGLGLALTRTAIERMGGSVAVESVLNEGTTFRLVLPAAAAPL